MWFGIPICVLALICSAVGVGIPYWAVYDDKLTGKINYGIYQVCSDHPLVGCEFTDPTGLMIAIRALESLGTLLILISLILAIVKQCSKAGQQSLFKAAGNLIIIAGVLIFIGIAIFGAAREKQTKYAENYTLHAGFFISIAAGILSLIAGLLFLIDKMIEDSRRHDTS